MTYMPVRPYFADTMGPSLYGLGGCGCAEASPQTRPRSAALSGGCGCGGGRSAALSGDCGCGGSSSSLGDGPLTSYLCSETAVARAIKEDANEAALVIGIGAGAAAGIVGGALRSPVLGIMAGALLGYLVYTTQRLPTT